MKRIITISVFLVLAIALVGCAKASREFSMVGHNISSLDTNLIVKKIMEFENLDEQTPIYVNGKNFELTLTSDFDWADDGAIEFFYMKKEDTYGAQLRLFNEENKYFITETTQLPKQEKVYKIEFYLDALKYIPQEQIREFFPNADKYLLFQMESGTPNGYEHSTLYGPSGIRDSDGWLIHLCIQPLYKKDGAYTSSVKDGAMHLFYSNK